MKNTFTKVLLWIVGLMVVVIIAVNILLFVYKDAIKGIIDKQIAENIDANVYFDADKFSLSLFKDFPNLSVTLGDFGIVGKGVFANDTLTAIEEFNISLNLSSVIFGEAIEVDGISLENPQIFVTVLENGKANYDIAKSSGEATPTETDATESSAMKIKVNYWSINNGNVVYQDATMAFAMAIENLNHSGNGDFTLDNFDMRTQTDIEKFTVFFDGVTYIKEKRLKADITMNMDLPTFTFKFRENTAYLNDFAVSLDGTFKMPDNGYEMDMTFAGKNNSFKSILSLVPSVFLEGFEDLKTSGNVSFDGVLKGTYDDVAQKMPTFKMNLNIDNAMFQYPDLPTAVKNVNLALLVDVPNGEINNSLIDLSKFHLEIGENPLDATFKMKGAETYHAKVATKMDLENIAKIVHLDSMELKGIIEADMEASGKMSYVEKEQYDKLPANGKMEITDLYFASADLPQGFKIDEALMTFSPANIALEKYSGFLGKSDLQLEGKIENYIGYAFADAVLKGNFKMTSTTFDVNEWLSDEEETTETDTTSLDLEVIPIPKNIDFTFISEMNKIIYDNMEILDLEGKITAKNGIASLEKGTFSLLGAAMKGAGAYNTFDPKKPKFAFDMAIKGLSFKKSYETFNTIKKLAPIAKNVEGTFDMNFKINGDLGKDMMPIYGTISGAGDMFIKDAALKDVGVFNLISEKAGIKELKDPTLKDVKASFEIRDGKLWVQPFDVKLGGIKSEVQGYSSLDGTMNFVIDSNIPASKLGSGIGTQFAAFSGQTAIPITFNISGTYDKPKVGLGKGNTKDAAKNAVKNAIKEEKEKAKKEVKDAAKNLVNDMLTDTTKSNTDKVKDAAKGLEDAFKGKIKFGKKKKKKGN